MPGILKTFLYTIEEKREGTTYTSGAKIEVDYYSDSIGISDRYTDNYITLPIELLEKFLATHKELTNG